MQFRFEMKWKHYFGQRNRKKISKNAFLFQ